MSSLSGLYPPIPTPFDDGERIAFDKLEANLRQWAAQPLDGVVMPGSNSEAAFLTQAERIDVWKVCAPILRDANKRFIAGTGAETTAETIQLTQLAAELGAQAALVLPPYFYKASLNHDALVAHYRAVADASPIPLLVYNVPAFTGIDFALPTFLAFAEHPQIVGVKDSSSNIVKMAELLAARPDFQVFAGTGSALANIAARPLRQLVNHFDNGQQQAARRLQLALAGINGAITTRFGVSGLKYAMDQTGFYGGPARRPLLPLGAAGRAEIDRLLVELRAYDDDGSSG
jgi:4-hydroxy-2-oxoglutarate aldolase